VYYRTSSAYYVVNFTCSGGSPGVAGTLSGNWTFETTSAVSYSGPVDSGTCTLSTGGPPWSLSTSNITVSCGTVNCKSATLDNLALLNISATKTYVNNEYCPPPPDPAKPQCIVINATVTNTSGHTDSFASQTADGADYGTLTMQLPKP
jgi:hypothetical protein